MELEELEVRTISKDLPSTPSNHTYVTLSTGDPSPTFGRKSSTMYPDSAINSPSRRESDAPDYVAASGISDHVMQLLIDNGADVNAKDKYHLTALHHAAIRGHVTAIQRLMQTPEIDKEVSTLTSYNIIITIVYYHVRNCLSS